MLHFDDLQYYSIPSLPSDWRAPSWLVHDLGIFSGRLYFRFEEYDTLCGYLGLSSRTENASFSKDGEDKDTVDFEDCEGNREDLIPHRETAQSPFTDRPLVFMQEWLTIRRKGQDFALTPMGYICQGKRLARDGTFLIDQTATGEEVEDQDGSDTDAMSIDGREQHVVIGHVDGSGSHAEVDATPYDYDDMEMDID